MVHWCDAAGLPVPLAMAMVDHKTMNTWAGYASRARLAVGGLQRFRDQVWQQTSPELRRLLTPAVPATS